MAVKKRFPQFLLSMYVFCVFVCLSVIALQTSSFDIGVWNFNIDTYIKISQNGIFYFFEFLLFSELSPFFIFHYFLYFETTSQPIMEINTPNWSLGLVEYIKYKGISSHSYDVMIWRHKFQISKLSPQFKHFECLLDYWCYMYNVSCC